MLKGNRKKKQQQPTLVPSILHKIKNIGTEKQCSSFQPSHEGSKNGFFYKPTIKLVLQAVLSSHRSRKGKELPTRI